MTHTFKTTALDKAFNCMVLTMANITAPSWETVEEHEAPSSLDELIDMSTERGHIIVSKGHSDKTIFGEPEFNWAFRAWHDSAHFRINAPFTLEGEIAACEQQIKDMVQRYGKSKQTDKWAQMIRIEVIGQAIHFENEGAFPVDQVAFMQSKLEAGAYAD